MHFCTVEPRSRRVRHSQYLTKSLESFVGGQIEGFSYGQHLTFVQERVNGEIYGIVDGVTIGKNTFGSVVKMPDELHPFHELTLYHNSSSYHCSLGCLYEQDGSVFMVREYDPKFRPLTQRGLHSSLFDYTQAARISTPKIRGMDYDPHKPFGRVVNYINAAILKLLLLQSRNRPVHGALLDFIAIEQMIQDGW